MNKDEDVYKEFGRKLKLFRERSSLTQKEISEELGISRSALTQYENGLRKVPLNMIVKFAKLFNVGVDELIDLEMETKRKYVVSTDDKVLSAGYEKLQEAIEYGHFSDNEIDKIIEYAKFLISQRQ